MDFKITLKYSIQTLLAILLLLQGFAFGENRYSVIDSVNKSGASYVRVINHTNKTLYCFIDGPSYFKDFAVKAGKKSRRYKKPRGSKVYCK